ncbi:aminoglycoside phosphotransferase family protein [Streptomyces sp. NPDC093085]|uniref:aminoglycoside phosphotransferase family protein n=1 Tax=Streptomyces sp. NPDC093085 TaxID=3155068 RepID=UPI00341A7091
MTDKPFPSDLREWVTTNLNGLDGVTDVSWPRGNSRVWRVTAGPNAAFVKLSPSELDFDREIVGYAYAAQVLDDREAPRLLAAHPGLRAIMSSPLPGKVVRELPLDKGAESRVYEDAGRLLRRWHDHSGLPSEDDRQAVGTAMREQADEAAACLRSTAEHLNADELALVEAASKELPELAGHLPLVFQHGDYSTRNWLWDAETRQHALIDFAMSRYGHAVGEFVWLCGAVWATRPDLKAAYFAGYGRDLSEREERLLRLLTVRLGVSYLNSGLVKDREDLVQRGHLVLGRMTNEYR